jgi:hypothetical protein
LIKGALHQDVITIINIYTPIVATPNFTKQTLLEIKIWIDHSTITGGDFHTPF